MRHHGLVEIDKHACATLRSNRPEWNVVEADLNTFDGEAFKGTEIIAGGLPCPPFSVAGKQLGHLDERNLFPAMIRLVDQIRPVAVMIENVKGILDPRFEWYRNHIGGELGKLGYQIGWKLHHASAFGVSQLRPRVVMVAIRRSAADRFSWPLPQQAQPPTVGDLLHDLIAANNWSGADDWRARANQIAPTIVGGSHKHGGPDLARYF
jgi:DNA (cytosine-5)-methyltransferase 1